MLDELEHRAVELHRAQHDLPREQVGQPEADLHPRQVGQQGAAGVAHHQVGQHQVVEERARDGAHLDVAVHDPVQQPRHHPRQQIAAGRRERHRSHHPEHHRPGAEQEDEDEAGHPAAHQKAWPTAKW